VDKHKSKLPKIKNDKSLSPEAGSHNGTPSATAQSLVAATTNTEVVDDQRPFHYAPVLKVPGARDDANNIVLMDDDVEDFEIELSEYLTTHGETRRIPANEPQLPWNRLKFLKMPEGWASSGKVSDVFPCTLSPRELAEQLGCHPTDLRRVFFTVNEHTATAELLLLKTKDINTASDSGKTLEAVVKKIYTDEIIPEPDFLMHLGMLQKELYHYHMQEDLWQPENALAAKLSTSPEAHPSFP